MMTCFLIFFISNAFSFFDSDFLATGVSSIESRSGMPLLIGAKKFVFSKRVSVEGLLGSQLSAQEATNIVSSFRTNLELLQHSKFTLYTLGGAGLSINAREIKDTPKINYALHYGLGSSYAICESLSLRAELSPKWAILVLTHGI